MNDSKNFKKLFKFEKLRVYILVVLVACAALLLFGKLALLPVYIAVGIFLGYYTTLYAKFVPHITTESMTAMSILAGMIFGSSIGFWFGILVSLIVYVAVGMLKYTTIVNAFVIATGGLYSGYLINVLDISPAFIFGLSLMLRAITGVLIFWNLTSDRIEAIAHAVFDPLWNFFIYMPLILPLYQLLR